MIMTDVDYDPRHKPYRYPLDSGLVYVWHGGPYIDLVHQDEDGDVPTDVCLNVWDYEHDRARIDLTPLAFMTVVCEHAGEEIPGMVQVTEMAHGYLIDVR